MTSFPGPTCSTLERDFALSLRLYHALTQPELESRTGVPVKQIGFAENGRGYNLVRLRMIHDAGLLPDEAMRAVLTRFHHLAPDEHATVASWLAEWRHTTGMSQEQLGAAVGRSGQSISGIENHLGSPSRALARELCVVSGMPDELREQGLAHFYPPTPPADTAPANHTIGSWVAAQCRNAELTQRQLAAAARLHYRYVNQVIHNTRTPRLRAFRRLCDALDVCGAARMEAVRRFYGERYPNVADPEDDQLFWRLVDTRVGSEQERQLRNQIFQRYDWVAERAARWWARTPAERAEIHQVARVAILTAIVNHVPTGLFVAHAFASARWEVRAADFERRYPDLDRGTRRIVVAVAAHLGRVDPAGPVPSPAEVAAVVGRKPAEVTRALQILGHPNVSLDQPLTSRSGDEFHRQIADPSASTAIADSELVDSVRAALAALPRPWDRHRAGHRPPGPGHPLALAAEQLGLSEQAAAAVLTTAMPLLRNAFRTVTAESATTVEAETER